VIRSTAAHPPRLYAEVVRYAAIILAVGCGTNHAPAPAPVNECAATESVTELSALTNAMATMDGPTGFAAADTMFADGIAIFDTGCRAAALPPGAGVSASCSPASCTFTVRFAMYPEIYNFDGTVMRDGEVLTVSLHSFDGHNSEAGRDWSIDGSLTIESSTIDGSLHATGSDTLGYPATYDTTVDYRAVVVDASGCPIGGSMYATNVTKIDPSSGMQSQNVDGVLDFGPACAR
jgi:hypothetical protein